MRIRRNIWMVISALVILFSVVPASADSADVTVIMDNTTCCRFSFIHSATAQGGNHGGFYNSGAILWRLSGSLTGTIFDDGSSLTLNVSGTLTLTSRHGSVGGGTVTMTVQLTAPTGGGLASGTVTYVISAPGSPSASGTFYIHDNNFGSGGDPNDPNTIYLDRFHIWGNNFQDTNPPAGGPPPADAVGLDLSGQIQVSEPGSLPLLATGLLLLGFAACMRKF